MAKTTLGLGRGLDALFDTTPVQTSGSSSINEVEIALIEPNPNQPRRNFDEDALHELALSIKEHGVIAPITLRKNEDGKYIIIAGERRWRASKEAGLTTIPAYIREAKDEQVAEWALIENIVREDLDAIEIALAYQRLMEEYKLTQENVSQKVGKKRATVSNYLRLLKLPAEIQLGIQHKKIEMGHARALLAAESVEDQLLIYNRILDEGLSVRKVENIISSGAIKSTATKKAKSIKSPELKAMKKELTEFFGTKVAIACDENGKGKITVKFSNSEELTAIMLKIK